MKFREFAKSSVLIGPFQNGDRWLRLAVPIYTGPEIRLKHFHWSYVALERWMDWFARSRTRAMRPSFSDFCDPFGRTFEEQIVFTRHTCRQPIFIIGLQKLIKLSIIDKYSSPRSEITSKNLPSFKSISLAQDLLSKARSVLRIQNL